MKKFAVCLLAAVLLCAAAGCGEKNENIQTPSAGSDVTAESAPVSPVQPPAAPPATQEPEPVPPVETPPAEPVPPVQEPIREETVTYRVERDIYRQTFQTDDENAIKLGEIHYRLPLLQAVNENGEVIAEATTDVQKKALEVTAAFNEGFDIWRQENETMKQAAESDYEVWPERFQMGIHFVEELDFSYWQTDRLVSIQGDSYSYYGGAHPNTLLLAWNFDVVSGTYINPLAIGHDEQEFRVIIAEELIRLAEEKALELQMEATALYWEDYRSILMNWSEYPVSFGETEMQVRFSPYELGSYASGAHEFAISYEFLAPYLGDYGRELLGLTESA